MQLADRPDFGRRVTQVAAVALMVDDVVTVAVQTAAGSQAILSTFPALARPLGGNTTLLLIAVTATLIMCYVNLRDTVNRVSRTYDWSTPPATSIRAATKPPVRAPCPSRDAGVSVLLQRHALRRRCSGELIRTRDLAARTDADRLSMS